MRFPAKRFTRPGVEREGNGVELILRLDRQVGHLGHVLAQQATETQGHLATYDKNGNRTSDTYQGTQLVAQIGVDGSTQYVVHEGLVTMHYRYDAAGRLTETAVGAIDAQGNALGAAYATVVSQNYYDGAGRLIQSGPGSNLPSGYAAAALANPDAAYGTTRTANTYDTNGRLLSERITHLSGVLLRDTSYVGGYDAAGNVLSYVITDENGVATTTVSRVLLDDYRRTATTTTKVAPNGVAAVTSSTYAYDRNGQLAGVNTTSALGAVRSRQMHNDLNGNVLQTKDGDVITNRLVIDGRTYASWQGSATAAVWASSLTTMSGADIAGITALYQELLKRPPDQAGLEFWIGAMERGATLDDIREAIMSTEEYKKLQEQPPPDPEPEPEPEPDPDSCGERLLRFIRRAARPRAQRNGPCLLEGGARQRDLDLGGCRTDPIEPGVQESSEHASGTGPFRR